MKKWVLALAAMAFIAGGGMAFADDCLDGCHEKEEECSMDCAGDDEECKDTCSTRYINCAQKCGNSSW